MAVASITVRISMLMEWGDPSYEYVYENGETRYRTTKKHWEIHSKQWEVYHAIWAQ